jgi:DNA polymerase (family 10)
MEAKLVEEISKGKQAPQRFKISNAEDFAAGLTAYLKTLPRVRQVVVAGSYRCRKETVGDLDILVTAKDGRS